MAKSNSKKKSSHRVESKKSEPKKEAKVEKVIPLKVVEDVESEDVESDVESEEIEDEVDEDVESDVESDEESEDEEEQEDDEEGEDEGEEQKEAAVTEPTEPVKRKPGRPRRDGSAPKKEPTRKNKPRQPWKIRQTMRLERAQKALNRLSKLYVAAKPPGVNGGELELALGKVNATLLETAKLPEDWKPARGSVVGTASRIGIGSVVSVKDGLEGDDLKVYKHIPASLYANSTIVDDDVRYWMVKCQDGVARLLRKKHAVLQEQ